MGKFLRMCLRSASNNSKVTTPCRWSGIFSYSLHYFTSGTEL